MVTLVKVTHNFGNKNRLKNLPKGRHTISLGRRVTYDSPTHRLSSPFLIDTARHRWWMNEKKTDESIKLTRCASHNCFHTIIFKLFKAPVPHTSAASHSQFELPCEDRDKVFCAGEKFASGKLQGSEGVYSQRSSSITHGCSTSIYIHHS